MNSPYELTSVAEDTIDLLSGFPSRSSLSDAAEILKKASTDLLDAELECNCGRMIYLRTEDETEMLKTLAQFLSEQYQDKVIESNLIFTGGASSAFVYLWSQLLNRNRKVIVASPTYQLLLNCLTKDLKYDIESVPEDSDGINLDIVENILKREYGLHGTEKDFTCGIYLVPTFSNPTGMLYTEKFGHRITQLVEKYNAVVVCDDVYNLLYATESPPKRLVSYETNETQGHIVSSGSFSKYLSPAIRLGWIEAHPPLIIKIKNWGVLQSANCLAQYSAMLVTTAIRNGDITRHIQEERANIKTRLETAKNVLKQNLSSDIGISPSMGGYFIWVKLPDDFPLEELQKKCSQRHITFLPGYIHTNMANCNRMRISVSRADNVAKLSEGLEAICSFINVLK